MRTFTGLVAAALAAVAFVAPAMGQLAPDRLYYGKDRAAPMTVKVPADASGQVEIQLLEPVTANVVEKANAAAGPVNLAALFPSLWTSATPKLVYAQLVVGGKKVGPAVVLQPMITPLLRQKGQKDFEPNPHRVYTGVRAYVDQHVVLDTTDGEIEIELRPDVAPNTAFNWRQLVAGGFYTDIAVHRIVAHHPSGKGFVIQFGDPMGVGDGGPGYFIDLEPPTLPHDFGVVSMARTGDPNTGSSQVFICLSREATQTLDRDYTSFAQAVRGADVIQKIQGAPTGPGDRPTPPMPTIKSARLVDAPPYGEGPKPVTAPGAAATPGGR
jgi:peptidyl-prolyl cis-trans isomerase B (cyclophilin B)